MTKKAIAIFLFILPILSIGQNKIDTVKFYDVDRHMIKQGGMPAQYKINGKEVTREQWDLIDSANSRMVLCTPCYALVLNEDSILKSEGLYYYDYPKGKKAENVDIQVPGERHIWINKNPRQEGLWIYYDKEGNVIDRKVYKLKKQKAINFGK